MEVTIVGAAGYAGVELSRLLASHPRVTLSGLYEARFIGKLQSELFPHLRGLVDLPLRAFSIEDISREAKIAFCALPHGKSLEVVPALLDAGLKVIDLSADFRLPDVNVYEAWYQKHTAPELLERAVYGLPEIFRPQIPGADLIANPGCYPTSVLLPLIPLARRGLLADDPVIVNSLSGTSGAGRNANPELLFSEVSGGLKAYSVGVHRHAPEMEHYLNQSSRYSHPVLFVPHLVPAPRGILSTLYFRTTETKQEDELFRILSEDYGNEPFVRVLPPGSLPNTRNINGTNVIEIGIKTNESTGKTIFVSAIDNLLKGASGQAIQNLNLMLGIPETTGLELSAVFP